MATNPFDDTHGLDSSDPFDDPAITQGQNSTRHEYGLETETPKADSTYTLSSEPSRTDEMATRYVLERRELGSTTS